jgi:hypothetical protein
MEKRREGLDKVEDRNLENLIHGFDTLQCAYYLESTERKKL